MSITSASHNIFPAESFQLPAEKMLFFFWLECHSGRCDHRNSRRFIIIWSKSWRLGKRPKGIKNGHITLTLTVQMFVKMSIDDYLFLLVFLPLEESKKVKCVHDTAAYRIMHVMKRAGMIILSWPLWYTRGISVWLFSEQLKIPFLSTKQAVKRLRKKGRKIYQA